MLNTGLLVHLIERDRGGLDLVRQGLFDIDRGEVSQSVGRHHNPALKTLEASVLFERLIPILGHRTGSGIARPWVCRQPPEGGWAVNHRWFEKADVPFGWTRGGTNVLGGTLAEAVQFG
jgi:hypothetical protein